MKTVFFYVAVIALFFFSCNHKTKNIEVGYIQQLTGQMSKYGKTLQAALLAKTDMMNEERKQFNLSVTK